MRPCFAGQSDAQAPAQPCLSISRLRRVFRRTVLRLAALACAAALLWPLTGRARTEETPPRVILVVNSYLESSPWSSTIISALSRFGADRDDLDVFTEHMNVLMIGDRERLAEFERMLSDTYLTRRPDVVVLIGNPVYALLGDWLKDAWGADIPLIVCAEEDYTGPGEAYLYPRPLAAAERQPFEDLAEPENLTLLQAPAYLPQSIGLMRRMLPKLERIVFIGDERYVSRQTDSDLEELIRSQFSDLEYSSYRAGDMTIDSLFDALQRIDPERDGLLFSSWFSRRQIAGNTVLTSGSYKVIAGFLLPIFSLHYAGMEDSNLVGGYVYDRSDYEAHLLSVVGQVLGGRQPRDIPFYRPSGGPRFNYPAMLSRELDPARAPRETVFVDRPQSFYDRYRWYILLSLLALAGFILLQQWRISVLGRIRRAVEREAETAARYANLFNNMPILYMQERVLFDGDGHAVDTVFVDINERFAKWSGLSREALGKRGSELLPESSGDFLRFISMALSENRTVAFPYYFASIDTSYDVIVSRSYQPDLVDIFCLDSTELHKAQQRLRDINYKLTMALDVANIVPWKWDLVSNTILCDVARSLELNDGRDSEQLSVPDSRYFSKIHKEDRERVRKAYSDLIEGRSDKVREEYRVYTKDASGHRVDWIEAQAAVGARDAEGRPTMLIGSSLVITPRKDLERDLMTARDRAEESNRLKSAFLANMSHEIRTPLNAIVGFSGILASTDEPAEREQYVEIIENNNELLLQLISDILDLSKIESGMLEFVYTDFELNAFLREKEAITRQRVTDGVVVLCEAPADELWIRTDKNRVAQVLINLLTNAAKFTPEKGTIRFGYELQGDTIRFRVSDTGCGIPAEKQAAIFDRFVKLDEFKQGTGLGLPICRTILEHMGGRIGVESTPGQGSTFWFSLPFIAGKRAEMLTEAIDKPVVEKGKLTILVAEDNESNYRLFETILRADYRLLHAWNGQQAVELFEAHRPHLVLMDINMPVMNGYDATREIRRLSTDVPIIAVTAFAYATDEQRVMESGFSGFVAKPIQANRLKGLILDVLRARMMLI